ncbi:unnamed protein product [Auanema sp. JU1783]|nr:unnamed protein product [Auanema sp. JU1783]
MSEDVETIKPAETENTSEHVKESDNPAAIADFEMRFLNEKWYGRYKTTGQFMHHVEESWVELPEDDLEFIQQLWFEQEASEVKIIDGVRTKWNATTQQWEKDVEVDESFIAQYQAGYGVEYDYEKMNEERRALNPPKQEKKGKRAAAEPRPEGWIDMDDKVNAIYLSNLPTDITDEEFLNFVSKCGVVQPDARNGKPKAKLYKDEEGNLKGDGRCCYIKKESVDLALQILDGFMLKNREVKVEKAHFEIKGDYDPTKKRKKMSASQKKIYMDRQKRLFEWKADKPRNYRPKSDCTVIFKNVFTLEEMLENAALLFDIKEMFNELCSKYGTPKKLVLYDNNPEGVLSVAFETTEISDLVVKMLNGTVIRGKQIQASLWDGKTKYKVEETEEDRAKRMEHWDKIMQGENTEQQS